MSNSNASATHTAPRRGRRPKTQKRLGRPPKAAKSAANVTNGERDFAAAGTLTRTKALLLAALRVWELKHRINE